MTIKRITEIRNAINVLSTISDSEWAELCTVIQEKQKVEEQIKANVENTNKSLFERVTNLLHQLSIPVNIKGYAYLRSAIMYYMENEKSVSLTKELYPAIACEFDTTQARAERAIRHAIEVAIKRGNSEVIEKLFGNVEKYYKGKPSNGEVIATIAEYLELNMD